MAIRRRRSRRSTRLTGWQRLHLEMYIASSETYGEQLKTFVCFHGHEHRRAVWEANREAILADRDPQLAGRRPTAFWEYDFPEIYRRKKHLDVNGIVLLDSEGNPRPYQSQSCDDRQADVLKIFGLLSVEEELVLRSEYPCGDEYGCPRFLQKKPKAQSQDGGVVEFPEE